MSDRSSPEIFETLYNLLAENPTDEHKRIALRMWELSRQFDFCDEDLGADIALAKLGLARKGSRGMKYGPEKTTA